jgi:hypothetical protein
MTIGHAYKRSGFRLPAEIPSTKEIIDEAEEDEDAVAGYSRVTLAPPHVQSHVPQFSDPWANRSSTDRY